MVDRMEVKSLDKQIGDILRAVRSDGKRPLFPGTYPTCTGANQYPTKTESPSYPTIEY